MNVLLHILHLLTFNLNSSLLSTLFSIFGRTFQSEHAAKINKISRLCKKIDKKNR
nr:MAG TPA: hypothetical protein [Caudoviricetes sp.]